MRFGDPTPDFYMGDLKSAFQNVSQQPEEENKLLAIYLHHDGSILTNIFCFHVMKTKKVLSTLKNHFIVYGVDITKEDKANCFFDEVRTTISAEVSNAVKGIVLDKLPAFMLLSRDFGDRRVGISVIHGDVSGEELDQKLLEQHKLLTELA
ncbi:FAS-associated factor 1-like [Drosophila eugracilis]|uniref:FAS-associated factor 1-like n=1 Tax=Drosophila eugracilis TaxID=29029 RepID=UPI0007E83728|nr:FAS-associated factor 1-like [Drosophila eugracilis]